MDDGRMEYQDVKHSQADFSIHQGSKTPIPVGHKHSSSSPQQSHPVLSCHFCLLQVDPRGTLQVQVQPARGEARCPGQVVDPQKDRPLFPPRQPAGPEEVLPGQELALSHPGLRAKDSRDKRDQLGRGGTSSSLPKNSGIFQKEVPNISCLSIFSKIPINFGLFQKEIPNISRLSVFSL